MNPGWRSRGHAGFVLSTRWIGEKSRRQPVNSDICTILEAREKNSDRNNTINFHQHTRIRIELVVSVRSNVTSDRLKSIKTNIPDSDIKTKHTNICRWYQNVIASPCLLKKTSPLSREAHECIIIKWKEAHPRRPKVTSIVIKKQRK